MLLEKWMRWEPIPNLAHTYYIEAISDSIDGFKVLLFEEKNRHKKVSLLFEDSVDAYRSTDESYRRTLLYDLSQKYGNSFYGKWTFFKVVHSSYVQWLSEQSDGIIDSLELTHFVIIAADSILDIVDSCEPKVEFIDY